MYFPPHPIQIICCRSRWSAIIFSKSEPLTLNLKLYCGVCYCAVREFLLLIKMGALRVHETLEMCKLKLNSRTRTPVKLKKRKKTSVKLKKETSNLGNTWVMGYYGGLCSALVGYGFKWIHFVVLYIFSALRAWSRTLHWIVAGVVCK